MPQWTKDLLPWTPLLLIFLPYLLAGCTLTTESELGTPAATTVYVEPAETGSESSGDSTGPEPLGDVPPSLGRSCDLLDVLFVLDNSGSMDGDQAALATSVPGFIRTLEGLGLHDIHIGVTTADTYRGNTDGCQTVGALITQGRDGPCGPYASGSSYITLDDDLESVFACAFDPGVSTGLEWPSASAIGALDGYLNLEGKCNGGFQRLGSALDASDRASLVLVYITDEDDQSPGSPADWLDHLRWLRDDSLHDLTFVAIAGGECADPPTKIYELASMVYRSHVAPICTRDFSQVLANALPTIAEACDLEFEPAE